MAQKDSGSGNHRIRITFLDAMLADGVSVSSGDFSHGPQHVFWTCLDHIVKSRDMSPKNISLSTF